jgi:putative tricarboxylic transport membrane protein
MARVIAGSIGVVTRSSLLGVFVGIIPGIGTSTAAWIGYSVARNHTTQPEKFGEGNRDGVLGAESASNACEVGTIVPLLALGIPGSAAGAIMLAAINLVGMHPGPAMYARHGVEIWTIMFGIGLSGLVFAILAFPFIKCAETMSRLPVSILIGAIGTLCVMGAFLETQSTFGPMAMIVLGIVMVFGITLGLKPAPLIIGFVLGPGIEKELIRAYQIGGFERFTAPASLAILAIIAATLAAGIYRQKAAGAAKGPAAAAAGTQEIGAGRDQGGGSVLALIGLLVAMAMLAGTLSYPFFASLWVYFVAACFIALPSALLLAGDVRTRRPSLGAALAKLRAAAPGDRSLAAPAVVFAAFFLFIALIHPLGFLAASAVFCVCVTLFLDRSPRRAAIGAVAVVAMIWAVKSAFGFYLPPGPVGI